MSVDPPLKLEDPAAIPGDLRRELDAHRDLFEGNTFVEQVLAAHPDIPGILDRLRTHLSTKRIHAYHCTRELEAGYFQANGLRVLDIKAHRREFVERFGNRFTADEMAELRRILDKPISINESQGRNGMIWACLSRSLVVEGTDGFFKFFGGEALHRWWDAAAIVTPVLATIGHPVIVEAAFPACDLNSYCNLAKTVLSQYHRTIRPDAHDHACEGFLRWPVPPQDVIAVTPKDRFIP
jgi:hypothetical protein